MAKQIKEWTDADMDVIIPKALEAIESQYAADLDDRFKAILITTWVDGYCSAVQDAQPDIPDTNDMEAPAEVEVAQPEIDTTEIEQEVYVDINEVEQEVEVYADTTDTAEVYNEPDTTETELQENQTGFGKWQ